MLDSQRALFSQQEQLVTAKGGVTQSLIALYKAMGGGWQAGRARPILDDATRATMGERSDWKQLLDAPLPPLPKIPTVPADGRAMNDEADATPAPPRRSPVPAAAPARAPSSSRRSS